MCILVIPSPSQQRFTTASPGIDSDLCRVSSGSEPEENTKYPGGSSELDHRGPAVTYRCDRVRYQEPKFMRQEVIEQVNESKNGLGTQRFL